MTDAELLAKGLQMLDRAISHPFIVGSDGVKFAKGLKELLLTDPTIITKLTPHVMSQWSSKDEESS